MTATWAEVLANRRGVIYKPTVLYSVCGTGVGWNVGYPYDLCEALVAAGLPFIHQPVNYPAATFPMQPSINAGVAELSRLMTSAWLGEWYLPDLDAIPVGYSQGAIVTSDVLDLWRAGKLGGFKGEIVAGVTWGNPRREAGHTIAFPGAMDPGGSGIVTPNLIDTPSWWWDFADGKAMANSPGNDLYTTCGVGETAQAKADQHAVWEIIATETIVGGGSLTDEIWTIAKSLGLNFTADIGGIEAALGALDFFVTEGITPHTSYQFVQPVPGHNRDCWGMAYDYLYQVGTTGPMKSTATQGEITMTEPTAPVETSSILSDLPTFKADAEKFVAEALSVASFLQKYAGILPIPAALVTDLDEAVKGLTFVNGVLNAI
jgi:Cutinase